MLDPQHNLQEYGLFVTAHYPLRRYELAEFSEVVLGLAPPESEEYGEEGLHGLGSSL